MKDCGSTTQGKRRPAGACLLFAMALTGAVLGGACRQAQAGQSDRLWPVPQGVSLGVMMGVAMGEATASNPPAPSSEPVQDAKQTAALPARGDGSRKRTRRHRTRSRVRPAQFTAMSHGETGRWWFP